MQQRSRFRSYVISAVVAVFVVANGDFALAQEENSNSSALGDIVRGVVFDPTTYAPALISYDATMRDWKTSQVFFQNGYVERNYRFTVSGLPNDTPVSYRDGRNQILRDTLTTLAVSAAQNTTSRIVERALLAQYPDHPKVVKTIGWIQRIALASLMSYHLSAAHYRQAGLNTRRARELGFN